MKFCSPIVTLAALAAISLSCTKEIEEEKSIETNNTQQEETTGDLTYFTASMYWDGGAAKTYIDNQDASGKYPVKWSASDELFLNGKKSIDGSVEVSSGNPSQVKFAVNHVRAPYYAISPWYAASNATYKPAENYAVVTVAGTGSPQYHEYSAQPTYSPKLAIMAAYGNNPNSLEFQHLMVYLKFKVTSGSYSKAKIKEVHIKQNTKNTKESHIAGRWKITFSTNGGVHDFQPSTRSVPIMWTAIRAGHDGLELNEPFIIVLPAYNYSSGLVVAVTDINDHTQNYILEKEKTDFSTCRGKILYKELTDFNPLTKAKIKSVEDWNDFAAAMNAEPRGDISGWLDEAGGNTVSIGSDIETTALTRIEKMDYNLNGNNMVITQTAATDALFNELSATVSDLTLKGELTTSANATVASFAKEMTSNGSMENCVNEMPITATVENKDVKIGGLVECNHGGSMTNCTNKGAITVNTTITSNDYSLQVGGIAAQIYVVGDAVSANEECTFENCDNTGSITINPTVTNHNIINYNSVGGIIGWCRHETAYTLNLTGCDNSGSITYSGDDITDYAGGAYCCVGGIIGNGTGIAVSGGNKPNLDFTVNSQINLTSCTNSGTITNCFVNYSYSYQSANKVYTGGIAGSLFGNATTRATVSGCTNTGTIIPYNLYGDDSSSRPGYCQVTGGLIGIGGYVDMSNVKVNCTIGDGKRPSVAYAGVIGFTMNPFTLENSTIWFTGYFTRHEGAKYNRAYGFVVPVKYGDTDMTIAPVVTGSVIQNCTIGSAFMTSTGTTATDDKTDQSGKLDITFSPVSTVSTNNANCVCGQGYTDTGEPEPNVTFTNVTYVKSNPFTLQDQAEITQ